MTKAEATQVCARIIGPIMLVVGAVVPARFDEMALIIPAILGDGPLSFITGIFTLICGVVLLAVHHHWSSPPAIVVTLLGFFTALRGVTLMFAPSILTGLANQVFNLGPGALIGGAIALLLGAWLTFVGWFAKSA
jgi:hypothetical protein